MANLGFGTLVSWFRNSLHSRGESFKRISEPNDTRTLSLLGRVLINRARLDVRSHSNSGARADIAWLRLWATCGRTRPAATSTSSALRPRSFPFWRAARPSDESSSDPADQTRERYACERRKDKKTNARAGIKKIRVWTEPERHVEHGLNNADALPRICN